MFDQTHTHSSVQARIAELVPDVLKLEFGCRVKHKTYKENGQEIEGLETTSKISVLKDGKYKNQIGDIIPSKFEILGRDATLADVLRAIDNVINSWNLKVFANGIMASNDTVSEVQWNLSLPLSGQSQEVIDFIGELLK